MMLSPADEPSKDSIMPARRPPRFTIHRIDSPGDSNYSAYWRVDSQTYWVRVWTDAQWRLLAEPDRPRNACRLTAGGWLVFRSIEEPPPVATVPLEPFGGAGAVGVLSILSVVLQLALRPFGGAGAVRVLPSPDSGTSAPGPDGVPVVSWSGTLRIPDEKVVGVLSILSVVLQVIAFVRVLAPLL
jgi:hypothetical protein